MTNEEMPWVNLTQEEVEELRNKKHELTEYGKQRLGELMSKVFVPDEPEWYDEVEWDEKDNPTHEDMLDEAERRERSNVVLSRYNDFYNMECASLPHGTPITPEHQQMITLQCMIDALRCENLNVDDSVLAVSDIEDLIARLDEQATEYLERVEKLKSNQHET